MSDGHVHKPVSTTRMILLTLLIGGWLAATLLGLWWFQQQNVRPFVDAGDDASFWRTHSVDERLRPLLEALPPALPEQVTLIHFWNPDCLCNQLSQRHFDGLISAFSNEQLRILVVAPASISDQQLQEFEQLNGQRMQIIREPYPLNLPVSPGLALYGPDQTFGYFGAYGFGALCTVANDEFFPSIVRKMSAGEAYGPFANVAGSGCFCAWPKPDAQGATGDAGD